MLFVAFGVDFGNLRPSQTNAQAMDRLCQAWNEALSREGASARVIHWYHKTGNFIIEADGLDVSEVNRLLQQASCGEEFAVFEHGTFERWTEAVRTIAKSPPPPTPGRRWTPGMVMDTNPLGFGPSQPTGKAPVTFGELSEARLRLAWRNDLLVPGRNVLDKKRREGGWGNVSSQMEKHAGGKWTARALSRAAGLLSDFKRRGPRVRS